MQSVVITQHGGEPVKLSCPECEGTDLRYVEKGSTEYEIRALHGHTLRIGEGKAIGEAEYFIVCKLCNEPLLMPAWMETEMSET